MMKCWLTGFLKSSKIALSMLLRASWKCPGQRKSQAVSRFTLRYDIKILILIIIIINY